MKKVILYFSLVLGLSLGMTSCDDFFQTDPDNIMNDEDYMKEEADMYRGYLGIQTRMQEVGDQAIWLTDLRSAFLQSTNNAPVSLQNINNYSPTDGNEYADPTGYYAVVVACNDFIVKVDEFYRDTKGAMSDSAKVHIPRLVSSALRYKVWAYMMLGKIYGEAYYFDTNVTELTSLKGSDFQYMTMKDLSAKLVDLLNNGIYCCGQQIPADLTMDWTYWVNPVTPNEAYDYWKYMSIDYSCLKAECLSWKASYTDAYSDWYELRELTLNALAYAPLVYTADDGTQRWKYYMCSKQTMMNYSEIFYSEKVGWEPHLVSAIFYDYENKQTNRLVQYLCPAYPDDGFYAKPSAYALNGMYANSDIRGKDQRFLITTINGEAAVTKYYYSRLVTSNNGYLRSKLYEIEPAILLYRGFELHYYLAEAENHLGHWDVARSLLNNGIAGRFPEVITSNNGAEYYAETYFPKDTLDNLPVWDSRYGYFFAGDFTNSYPNIGLVGCLGGAEYDLPTIGDDASETEKRTFAYDQNRMKAYDLALAEEFQKEFTAEGKAYSYIVKMAERYKDADIVYNLVKPKYEGTAYQAQVKSSLEQSVFIKWTLE